MNTEEVGELFEAFNDAGIRLGFGGDACTNIPNPHDPDDTGWHLMLHDERLLEGKRILSTASWRNGVWSGSTRNSWAGSTYPSTGQATGSPAGNHMDTKPSTPRGEGSEFEYSRRPD